MQASDPKDFHYGLGRREGDMIPFENHYKRVTDGQLTEVWLADGPDGRPYWTRTRPAPDLKVVEN